MKKDQRTIKKEKQENSVSLNLIVLFLAFIPLFFSGIFQGGYFAWETYLTFLLSLPSVILFSYLKFVKKEPFKGIEGLNVAIFLFLLVSFFSLFFTVYFYATLTEFFKVVLYVFMFYIAVNTVENEKIYKVSLIVILFLSFILSLIGILAYIGYKLNIGLPFFKFLLGRGFAVNGIIASTFQYSNTFGAFLVLPMFISVGFFLYENAVLRKILYSFLFVFFFITFILTQSRGAILTFLAGLIVFVLLLKGKERLYSILSIVGLFVVGAIFVMLKKDVVFPYLGTLIYKFNVLLNFLKNGSYDESLGGRIYMIKDTFRILKDYPIFGAGFGTYQYIYAKYRSIYFFSKFPHSLLFQYLSEGGILGCIALLFFVVLLIHKGYKVVKSHYSPLNVGLFSGLVGILLHAFIDFDWSLMFIPLITLFSFGLLLSEGDKTNIDFNKILGKFNLKPHKSETKHATRSKDNASVNKIFAFILISFLITILLIFMFISVNLDRLALSNQGKVPLEKTISDFESAILFNPLNASPRYNLANLYAQIVKSQGNADQSKVSVTKLLYEEAIKKCPMYFLYHFDYAKFLYTIGDENAISEFRKTIELNPLDPGAHSSLAIAYLNLKNDLTDAKSELDLALSLAQDAIDKGLIGKDILTDIYIGYGLYYEKVGNLAKAIENYKLAISTSPNNPYAYYKAGSLEVKNGELPQGIQHLFYAYYYNPNDPTIRAEFEKYAPVILVASPKNGETFKKGGEINITWIPTNDKNVERYVIWLIPPKGDWILINGNLSPKTLSYKYTLPNNVSEGAYTLRIYAVSHKIMQGQLGDWISFGEVKINIAR
ncbi:O-antigen ligase family protein [Caldisericum sp.]|uniref:O-antigen ligase family protein n=1 Tax=Caldisericum sp. TaxID=2499687 RepID=UPI003D1197B3